MACTCRKEVCLHCGGRDWGLLNVIECYQVFIECLLSASHSPNEYTFSVSVDTYH